MRENVTSDIFCASLGPILFIVIISLWDLKQRASNLTLNGAASSKVVRVVLTGGPCSGKSSSLEIFETKLVEKGWAVYKCPEVPTLLIHAGLKYPGEDPSKFKELLNFESTMLRLQLEFEDAIYRVATVSDQKSVIICDRGALDIAAYMPAPLWTLVLNRENTNMEELTNRYHIVIHLVTAADGASEFYTTANNKARLESPEQAVLLDKRSQASWQHHPKVAIIRNGPGGFKSKVDEATKFLLENIAD